MNDIPLPLTGGCQCGAVRYFGVESQVPWLKLEDGLPREATETGAGSPVHAMVSHQR